MRSIINCRRSLSLKVNNYDRKGMKKGMDVAIIKENIIILLKQNVEKQNQISSFCLAYMTRAKGRGWISLEAKTKESKKWILMSIR